MASGLHYDLTRLGVCVERDAPVLPQASFLAAFPKHPSLASCILLHLRVTGLLGSQSPSEEKNSPKFSSSLYFGPLCLPAPQPLLFLLLLG